MNPYPSPSPFAPLNEVFDDKDDPFSKRHDPLSSDIGPYSPVGKLKNDSDQDWQYEEEKLDSD